jgi:hypothetical protein
VGQSRIEVKAHETDLFVHASDCIAAVAECGQG